MKRIFIGICAVLLCAVYSPSYANPPLEVTLNYNKADSILKIIVLHPVRDPSQHHIGKIEIMVNGKMIIREVPPVQSRDRLIVEYPVKDVRPGDIVRVVAFCNKSGERANEIKIPK